MSSNRAAREKRGEVGRESKRESKGEGNPHTSVLTALVAAQLVRLNVDRFAYSGVHRQHAMANAESGVSVRTSMMTYDLHSLAVVYWGA